MMLDCDHAPPQAAGARTLIRTAACAAALACAVLLAGCGTFSGGGSTTRSDAQRGGGYYLDDGPGANPPANLDAIPDAVPRNEPLHRGTARPYTVMGRSYAPMTALAPYRERGVATWYGRRYHGKSTSSGEPYDMYAMTAAHTVLPIPSYARVTNLANGRSVVVRINDRGPFVDERLIDLSYVAAHKLDIVRNGSALVEVESLLAGGGATQPAPTQAARATPELAAARQEIPAAANDAAASPAAIPGQHFLQLGAFAVRANAERFLDEARLRLGANEAALDIVFDDNLFRVHAGPYASRADALQAAERVGQTLGGTPVLAGPR